MNKFRLIIAILCFLVATHAWSIEWEDDSLIVADINCDGTEDRSKIGYMNSGVVVHVTLGGSGRELSSEFGLGNPMSQSSLCGTHASLSKETPPKSSSDVFLYGLGIVPEGHKSLPGCYDLRLSGGECDSIHVYWNHEKKQLYWWRL